jgi:SAM-dependent methyltransferase
MDEKMYAHIQQVEQNHWWYVGRRKIIFDWTLQVLQKYQEPRILDIGCGTGFNTEYLKQSGYKDIVSLDISLNALQFCQTRDITKLVCADGTNPPFRNASFDVVMALDMIEHIEDDQACLKNMSRLVKRGGTVIIFTPAFNFLWGLQDEVSHHYRRYTVSELKTKVEKAGLEIYKITYANTFLFPVVWAGRLALKMRGNEIDGTSENDLHPSWSNGILKQIFSAERPLLHYMDMPFGVSLLCLAQMP